MKAPITTLDQLDLNGTYTYADYLTWRLDDRVERSKGKIFRMSPTPSRFHQDISVNLTRIISLHLYKGTCKLYHAPTDVRLIIKGSEDKEIISVVQPDLFVVCKSEKMDERGCLGSPDFVIEIISPHTSSRDLDLKYTLYEKSGVLEYWIIFPGDQIVECFVLENGVFKKSRVYAGDQVIPVRSLPGLEIRVVDIFER